MEVIAAHEEYVKTSDEFFHSSPVKRLVDKVNEALEKKMDFISMILAKIPIFSSSPEHTLRLMALNMKTKDFSQGDKIISQDDIGTEFWIIQSGNVSVSRKITPQNTKEVPKVLAHLTRGAYFGEMSLLTAEPRSATVTVTSQSCVMLSMGKASFENAIQSNDHAKDIEDLDTAALRGVIEKLPFFSAFTPLMVEKAIEELQVMAFKPQTYICRQGTVGNSMYIIIHGSCVVTHAGARRQEKEIKQLNQWDYFGESVLIENKANKMRPTNVISKTAVTCMSLTVAAFKGLAESVTPSSGFNDHHTKSIGAGGRRVSAFAQDANEVDAKLSYDIVRARGRFEMESLWLSLYWKFWRLLLLRHKEMQKAGPMAVNLIEMTDERIGAVRNTREAVSNLLSEVGLRRASSQALSFLVSFLKLDSELSSNYCKQWSEASFTSLARKVSFLQVKPGVEIRTMGDKADSALLILRGCVRLFRISSIGLKEFAEDLMAGEVVDGDVLTGGKFSQHIAWVVTNCDFLVINREDFAQARAHGSELLDVAQKLTFFRQLELFADVSTAKLKHLSNLAIQEEKRAGTLLLKEGEISSKFYLILGGIAHVQPRGNPDAAIPLASIEQNIFFGESAVLANVNQRAAGRRGTMAAMGSSSGGDESNPQPNTREFFTVMAGPGLQYFVLDPSVVSDLGPGVIKRLTRVSESRLAWRKARNRNLLSNMRSRQLLSKQTHEQVEMELKEELRHHEKTLLSSPVRAKGNTGGDQSIRDDLSISSLDTDNNTAAPSTALELLSLRPSGYSPTNRHPQAPEYLDMELDDAASLGTYSSLGTLGSLAHSKSRTIPAMMVSSNSTVKGDIEQQMRSLREHLEYSTSQINSKIDPIFAVGTAINEKSKKKMQSGFQNALAVETLSQGRIISRRAVKAHRARVAAGGFEEPDYSDTASISLRSSISSAGEQPLGRLSGTAGSTVRVALMKKKEQEREARMKATEAEMAEKEEGEKIAKAEERRAMNQDATISRLLTPVNDELPPTSS
jgi:CRP-like cAMP-binding protein